MNYQILQIPPTIEPVPIDYTGELQTLNLILDGIEYSQKEQRKYTLDESLRTTPWIAWQLGCLAELFASQMNYDQAVAIATVSLDAAFKCGDVTRIYANLLTAAGIMVRMNDFDGAEEFYITILGMPIQGKSIERTIAHLSLGSIYAMKGNLRRAVYHKEKALPQIKSLASEDILLKVFDELGYLYSEILDLAGIIFIVIEQQKHSEDDVISRFSVPDLSLEQVLLLVTRLSSLGKHELGERIINLWKKT